MFLISLCSFSFSNPKLPFRDFVDKYLMLCLISMSISALFESFLLSFIPLFFAIDALGIFPIYISLTQDLENNERKKLLRQALLTAFIISTVFLFCGKWLFEILGITADDFRLGGGLLLLLISILDIIQSEQEERRAPNKELGIVPIGIPLIIGPAALTTILILSDKHGFEVTLTSLLLNLIVVWIVFSNSQRIMKIMTPAGSRAFAKVASLILVAIAVMMIRISIENMIHSKY